MGIIDSLQWRYAVKSFDANRRVEPALLEILLESVRLSPSAFGLQPYRLIVIEDKTIRQKLLEHSRQQEKVVASSHLLVFAIRLSLDSEDIEKHLQLVAATRKLDRSELTGLEHALQRTSQGMDNASYRSWAAKQAYLALGNLLTVCSLQGVDACPMEGFSASGYDQVLGLTARGLGAVVLATLGYRSPDDAYAKLPKVRMPVGDFIIRF